MEGVSCFATRLWLSQTGSPNFMMGPFLRVTPNFPVKRIPAFYAPEVFLCSKNINYSFIPQIMSSQVEDSIPIVQHFLKHNVPWVDFNCGCPSPNAVSSRAGSGLLEKIEYFSAFTQSLERNFDLQNISLKMRSGFFSEDEFPELFQQVKDLRLARITIHPRTRQDRYTGLANWNLLHKASSCTQIPLFGSGDILDIQTFEQRTKIAPSLQGSIIGRGALRNPWIFEEIRSKQNTTMTTQGLLISLGVLAMLYHCLQVSPERLLKVVEKSFFAGFCNKNQDLWQELFHNLCNELDQPHNLAKLTIDKMALARVKMIWSYLRTSLPEVFFQALFLRSQSWEDFYNQYNMTQIAHGEKTIEIKYQQNYDWIFQGKR